MTEPAEDRPLKRTIPPDLQTQVEDIQIKVPRTTGPPDDLDDRRKRWLIVGICLHTIISPILRTYVVNVVTKLCYSLTSRNKIHKQTYGSFLKRYSPTNTKLNYEAINNNKTLYGQNRARYDYRVKNPVDLSRLFLQTHMAHFTAFDDSCDSSALLGIIVNIDRFPPVVRADARQIQSDIRNSWAHCDFTKWTAIKYTDSFQLMGLLITNLKLSNREENRILGELHRWAMNGQHCGTTLGLDIVGDIRQQTHILSEYVQTLCTETDSQFIKVQKELSRIENDLQERIKNLESKSMEHDETLNTLKEEIKKQVEDHIPPHIRAHHGQEIREWEQDQYTFFETRAMRHILESLSSHNCIVVTGSSGCGKSSNIHQAALHLRDSLEYEIIPVLTGPTDIMNYYNENKKQVFIVDDICGKETINMQTLQTWRDYSEKMEKIFKVAEKDVASKNDKTVLKVSSPKLLISCRLHIYKEAQFQCISLFTKKECNLLVPELCLLEVERMHMLHKYLPDDIIDNIKQVTENVDYFPLLCKLSKNKTSEEVKKLFTAPLISIKQSINNIINENKQQFCALVLCIVFDDGFDTDGLKLGSVSERKNIETDKHENIVKEFDINLSKQKHRNSLKADFSTLNGTYLKLRGTEYRMIHDKIYKMAAVICGQHLTECFIKYAPAVFIRDNFIFESVTEVHENDNLIVLSKDEEEYYFERLLCDLTKHVLISTFNNYQLIYQTFRDKLISFLRMNEDAKIVLEKLDTQGCKTIKDGNLEYLFKRNYYTTPLIESATTGYFDIVEFLIVNVKCDVNKTDERGNAPIHKASKRGHTAVAKLLLENNADVNQCNIDKQSPLYVACKGGYKDTVELLLQNNADVNQCEVCGESPLYVPYEGGHKDTVELLLQSNADVNQYNQFGQSPLYVACEGGHKDTVELLLQNNADVNQYNQFGRSPLYAACEGGYKHTVELLLQNNADVNHYDINEQSPLYVACARGHKDTVELLLQNKADVNQCTLFGQSPLYVACKGGHKDTVELLLQNKADVSKCDMFGESPLYVACEGGYKHTVELLIQKNADVNQCTLIGQSPLYVACVGGHKDTVKLLLQNNAGVDQCNQFGQSPLYAACKGGHKDTVELLLQNNADVNQCTLIGESPLYVACKGGYKDTVELLIQKNADVNQCTLIGQSPLYGACKGGYKDTVELLIQNNADVNHCGKDGISPLYVACAGGHKDIVELLLQNKAYVNPCGQSPLNVACQEGYKDIVELLLQNNADVNQCDSYRKNPLYAACKEGHKDTVELLLQKNADVNQCAINGKSPLYVACKGGHTDIVELLLQNNADVNQRDRYGQSPLYVACKRGHTDTVELLLQNNADVNQCNWYGQSPLYIACKGGHTYIIELLLQNKADVSQCNKDEESPLYVACKGGHTDTVELLVQNNADVNQCEGYGESPLYTACKGGHTDTVELLLQNKADVSQCNTKGESPLHAVFSFDFISDSFLNKYFIAQFSKRIIETVKPLLAWKADVTLRNKNGQTPLDIVHASQCEELVNIFEEHLQLKESQLK
ncbi:uncharacterized protein LOC143058366 [Mytilus galloprovincialis]|uniref:uncharacterized protein LOC143058366 n=1 Tax=Mytilus galloprovincialis TaxID=29158 RepID=UPI003F7C1D86